MADEEITPLLGSSNLGARPRLYYDSAPNVVLSPGGRSYEEYAQQVQRQRTRNALPRKAKGTGRAIPKNPAADHNNDPLAGSRTPMPYQTLLEQAMETPGAQVTRVAITTENPLKTSNEEQRQKYYGRLHNAMVDSLGIDTHAEEVAQRRRQRGQQRRGDRRQPPAGGDKAETDDDDITAADEAENSDEEDFEEGPNRMVYGFLVRPDHVIPPEFYRIHLPGEDPSSVGGKQSSLITILSIWNTMMGTSLLAMPWALRLSGLVAGPVIAIVLAAIALYTAILILKVHKKTCIQNNMMIAEFAQLCGVLLGQGYEIIASLMSLGAITGAAIVYWVLMSNFAYSTVAYFHDLASGLIPPDESANASLLCPPAPTPPNSSHPTYLFLPQKFRAGGNTSEGELSTFDAFWSPHNVAIYLVVILPLVSLKSVTFFTKFNSLGTITVFFLMGVVIYFASTWGINVNTTDVTSPNYVPLVLPTFFCLSGMLSLGMFIHNAIITIMNNNRYQENNTRDVTIAFSLVLGTYLFIGILFYISFPLNKSCIADNFLNNFPLHNPVMVACRALLLFQLITVFPLIMYIMRNQICLLLLKHNNPTKCFIVVINLAMITLCILITIFYPSIGTVIRFSGSGCGLALIFILPCLCHYFSMQRHAEMKPAVVAVELVLVFLGCLNFVAQFLPYVMSFNM